MADPSVQDLIRQEAEAAKIDPAIPLGVAERESSFNPTAVNKKVVKGETGGAAGVFQFLPSVAKARGFDPMDARANIHHGVTYLRELMDKHGDLDKALAEYGGVKTDTTYVPAVRALIQKHATANVPPPAAAHAATPPPAAAGQSASTTPAASPPPEGWGDWALRKGKEFVSGFDPRTSEGQRNLAGAAGAAAVSFAMPEVPAAGLLMRGAQLAAPAVGAFLGGAGAQTAQDVAAGKAPSLESSTSAGTQQATTEALGQAAAWPVRAIARRVLATPIAKSISSTLSEGIEAAKQSVSAATSRITGLRPSVSPAQAGRMVEAVAQGPARSLKDQLGEEVEKAAASGPRVDPAAITAKLDDATLQLNPGAAQAAAAGGAGAPPVPLNTPRAQMTPQQIAAQQQWLLQQQTTSVLPTDHPLPGALGRARQIIADNTGPDGKIPFQTVHEVKRMLDDAVNYKSPSSTTAMTQAQGATRGLRSVVRDSLRGHQPYDDATAAYAPIAKLFTEGNYPKLHKQILSNPEGLVNQMNWKSPTATQLVKELTVDTAQKGGAGAQGEAAWNAVRASWTHEKLTSKGPEGMLNEMRAMEASGNGQEFIKQMYESDPQGKMVWQNLKQIGEAWEQAVAKEEGATATGKAFAQSDLPKHTTTQAARDIGYVLAPGHSIFKLGAIARLLKGPNVGELLLWSAQSPDTTRFLVRHVLTGPNVGQAFADFARGYFGDEDQSQPLSGTMARITPPQSAQPAATPPPSR